MATIKPILAALLLLVATMNSVAANEVFAPTDIPLLENRFRIDHRVAEITFIVKRQTGSPAVVLVRPDGSKLYAGRVQSAEVGWLSLPEYDLITVRNPMPGPWQALGALAPDNRVRLLSDVQLNVSTLPLQLYQGEGLKVQAAVNVAGTRLTDAAFLSDLGLHVSLQAMPLTVADGNASNTMSDKADPNTERRIITLGHYQDEGKEWDEVPYDGVLTGYVQLGEVPAGRYRVQFSTANEVFSRAKQQELLIYPYPLDYQINTGQNSDAHLLVKIDEDELQAEQSHIQVRLTDVQGSSVLLQGAAKAGRIALTFSQLQPNRQYKVQSTVYSTTRSGREVVITLPTKTVAIMAPAPIIHSAVNVPSHTASAALSSQASVGKDFWAEYWRWFAAALLGVIGAAFAALWFLRKKKQTIQQAKLSPEPQEAPVTIDLTLPKQ